MAEDGKVPEVEEDAEELNLDDVREYLYVALRAQERFTQNLRVLVEDLDKRKEGEEWLEQVLEEAGKGRGFYESQLVSWEGFTQKVDTYVAVVRQEADELAIDELQVEKKGDKDASGEGTGKARRARTVHPELTKFKLEKQARILGKYGGVPAMGGGLVLGRLPREVILKATASPAAIEIQYSKVEGKDAQHLAQVMRFKAKKSAGGLAEGGDEPEQAAWQAEVLGRKGKQFFKELEAPAASSTVVHTAYADELAEKLKAQQASLAAAEAAAATPQRTNPSTPSIGSATGELAEKLKRQQASLKASEDQARVAAAAAAAEAAEAANPSTPSTSWANAAVPFGSELSAALKERQSRQQQQAAPAAAASSSTPAPASSPGFSFRTASNAISGAGGGGTPSASPAPALRRPPPGAVALTPPGAAANELEEAMRQRQARQAAAAAAAAAAGGQ